MNNIPLNYFNNTQKIIMCSKISENGINEKAVFSDETEGFRFPSEPDYKDFVKIKLRVGKNDFDSIAIFTENKNVFMKKKYTKGIFDYYEAILEPDVETKTYYFKLYKGTKEYFYTKKGFKYTYEPDSDFTVYRNFKTPDWVKGSVIYQIFIDRFYNGDKSNDVVTNEYIYLGRPVKKIDDWHLPVANDDVGNFYGGDIQGVLDKLPYLKDLGVEAVYFNPLFVSPSSHKYDIQDYDYIDPHIGKIVNDEEKPLVFEKFNNGFADMYIKRTTDNENLEASNEIFIRLVEKAHENNIKVIIDGVFNHCGAFNKWMDTENFYGRTKRFPVGAYLKEDSIYHNYFKWFEYKWPNNSEYDAWWGFKNHPKLNYEESKELYSYILEVGKKWVSPPFNADGWRLDVAADLGYSIGLNHRFWKDFRKSVKEANPNAVILAEHYGDAKSWLNGDEWDTVMNYDAFMEPISWFLTGMEKHSDAYDEDLYCNSDVFINTMKNNMSKFGYSSLYSAMNELSNHDHSRFLTRTNKTVGRLEHLGNEAAEKNINKGIMKEAVVFQMMWPGCPTIYYGDEAGLTGWTDPDNRRTFPWGKEDIELLNFHKEIIKLRKKYKVLNTGSVEFLHNEYGILSFARFNENEKIVVILNNRNEACSLNFPVWQCGIKIHSVLTKIFESYEEGFAIENDTDFNVENGMVNISLKPFSTMILLEK